MPEMQSMSPRTTQTLRIAGWSLVAVLLLLPVVAMQAGMQGVDWTTGDFLTAALVLGISGGLLELAARSTANLGYRLAATIGVGAGFLLLWINLAVDVVGREDSPANADYAVVLVAAVAGAIVASERPRALTRAMLATAGAHALVALVHARYGTSTLLFNGFFVALWLASAALFARAARAGPA